MTEEFERDEEDFGQSEANFQNQEDAVIEADIVEISMGGAGKIIANEVVLRQAGAKQVQAASVQVRQGGVLKLDAEKLEVSSGGVGLAKVQEAVFNNSSAVAVISKGAAHMDQSGAQVLMAGKGVEMDQSGAILMVSPHVTLDSSSGVVFLFSAKVDGEINTVFGPKESVLFGIMAGIAASVVFMVSALFRKKRKKD